MSKFVFWRLSSLTSSLPHEELDLQCVPTERPALSSFFGRPALFHQRRAWVFVIYTFQLRVSCFASLSRRFLSCGTVPFSSPWYLPSKNTRAKVWLTGCQLFHLRSTRRVRVHAYSLGVLSRGWLDNTELLIWRWKQLLQFPSQKSRRLCQAYVGGSTGLRYLLGAMCMWWVYEQVLWYSPVQLCAGLRRKATSENRDHKL